MHQRLSRGCRARETFPGGSEPRVGACRPDSRQAGACLCLSFLIRAAGVTLGLAPGVIGGKVVGSSFLAGPWIWSPPGPEEGNEPDKLESEPQGALCPPCPAPAAPVQLRQLLAPSGWLQVLGGRKGRDRRRLQPPAPLGAAGLSSGSRSQAGRARVSSELTPLSG